MQRLAVPKDFEKEVSARRGRSTLLGGLSRHMVGSIETLPVVLDHNSKALRLVPDPRLVPECFRAGNPPLPPSPVLDVEHYPDGRADISTVRSFGLAIY
jgi:hypothetical protein